MDPFDRRFRKSIHRRYDPEQPRRPLMPWWLAIVLTVLLLGASLLGAFNVF